MRTHIARLPEYYSFRDEDPSFGNVITRALAVNAFSKGLNNMPAKRVLVIDDEDKIRETYRRVLSSIGLEVMTASNAVNAQDLLVRNRFDIVLLDINMPEVEGPVLFEVMKFFRYNAKIIVSSVYPVNEQKDRIKDADGYFDKSDGKDMLVSLVSSLLEDPSLLDM